jgi:serine/threonine protein kinase
MAEGRLSVRWHTFMKSRSRTGTRQLTCPVTSCAAQSRIRLGCITERRRPARAFRRDLKPENFLLESPADDAPVKIADFGFACAVTSPTSVTGLCGSPGPSRRSSAVLYSPKSLVTSPSPGLLVRRWSRPPHGLKPASSYDLPASSYNLLSPGFKL